MAERPSGDPGERIELPKLDVEPRAERLIRSRVTQAFDDAHDERGFFARLSPRSLAAPAFVCGIAGVYLVWAFDRAAFLLQH